MGGYSGGSPDLSSLATTAQLAPLATAAQLAALAPTAYTDTSGATGTGVKVATTNASVNTYGGYTQMIAATAAAAKRLMVTCIPVVGNGYLKIAIGGAGSEVDVVKDIWIYEATNAGFVYPIEIQIAIAAGSRIAVAVASSVAGAQTFNVSLQIGA